MIILDSSGFGRRNFYQLSDIAVGQPPCSFGEPSQLPQEY